MNSKHQCLICSKRLQGFCRCTGCDGVFHDECRIAANDKCPRCASAISADLFFWPVTPVLDVTVTIIGVITILLILVASIMLSQIPFGADAPGTAGIAFYFFFIPTAAAALLFLLLFGILWIARSNRRQPARVVLGAEA